MPGTTPAYALPYQLDEDPPDGPALGHDLAQAVEDQLVRIDATLTTEVDDTAAWRPKYLRKGVDESVTSSIAFQDDNVFAGIAFDGGQTWDCLLDLDTSGGAPGGFKVTFTQAGGATIDRVFAIGVGDMHLGTPDNADFASLTARTPTGTIEFALDGSATHHPYVRLAFTVTTATAGTITLRWAQAVSDPTAATVKAESRFVAHRLA